MYDAYDTVQLKAENPISSVVASYIDLRRSGREMVGRCPFHADGTPSLYVSDEKGGVFNCFGCGAKGDVLDFVQMIEGCDFATAKAIIAGGCFSVRHHPMPSKPTKDVDRSSYARKCWDEARPLSGTVAERYLVEKRAIAIETLPGSDVLRFTRLSYDGDYGRHPVLLSAVRDVSGKLTGVQRTFLTEQGTKLAVHKPKLSLGEIKGNATPLGEWQEEMFLCEGLEDGLSIRQHIRGASVRVAAGAGMLKDMLVPSECRSIIIAADNDGPGEEAARQATTAFLDQGKAVHIMRPPTGFKDYNEFAQEAAR